MGFNAEYVDSDSSKILGEWQSRASDPYEELVKFAFNYGEWLCDVLDARRYVW